VTCLCKDETEDKFVVFTVKLGTCIVIIKNTPAQVCSQCGETSYSNEVAEQLELITKSVNEKITEIIVINYPLTIKKTKLR